VRSVDQPVSSADAENISEPGDAAADAPSARPLLADGRARVATFAGAAAVCVLSVALFGFGDRALVTAVTASVLVVLAAIDIEQRILPNRIVYPAIVVVLVLRLALFPDDAVQWLLAGPATGAFLALPLVVRRGEMGMGDIKLGVLLGAALGWDVFTAIIIGCLAMVPVALWLLRRDGSIRGATLPFGPFLAFGTLVILFAS
jgi:prepilin signal peptidase PulO-like enzyme (type II secretory pathway)